MVNIFLIFLLLIILILVISLIIINNFSIYSPTKKIGGDDTILLIPSNIEILNKNDLNNILGSRSSTQIESILFQERSNDNKLKLGDDGSVGVFSGYKIKELTIPNFITKIGKFAFKDCKELKSIIFEERPNWYDTNNTLEIGVSAFENCIELENLTIPSFVINIESFAFARCSKLVSITFENRILNGKNREITNEDEDEDNQYNAKYGDGKESDLTELNVENNVFFNCKMLKKIENIPDYLKEQEQFKIIIDQMDKTTFESTKSNKSKKRVRFADDITKDIVHKEMQIEKMQENRSIDSDEELDRQIIEKQKEISNELIASNEEIERENIRIERQIIERQEIEREMQMQEIEREMQMQEIEQKKISTLNTVKDTLFTISNSKNEYIKDLNNYLDT